MDRHDGTSEPERTVMNYSAVYCALISKRLQNPISKADCYCETHHIIPKSEGGDNDKSNLVNLTAREHYIAHLLLAKIYDDQKMYSALWWMSTFDNGKYVVSSRLFELAKQKRSLKLSKALKGKPSFMKGRHHSEDAKRKISEAGKGRKFSEEARRKISEALKGKTPWNKGQTSCYKLSDETKKKISESVKASMTEEVRAKISETHKGRTPWNKGITKHSQHGDTK